MRRSVILFAAAALAACQTVTAPSVAGFSRRQVEALEARGFEHVGRNYELGLSNRVLFYVDQSDLLPGTDRMLGDLAGALLKVDVHGATVEGYADSTGTAEYNLRLSGKRAESVKAQLVLSGMEQSRVKGLAMGEADPIESNDTEEGRAQNRRVVIVVSPEDAQAR